MGRQNPKRLLSLLLALLALITLASGVLHTIGVRVALGWFTVLWVHVASALLAIPLAVWHVVARRTVPRRVDLTRRNFIRLGGLVSAATLAWWGTEGAITVTRLPGAVRRFTGSHERSSFLPEGMPVTSWLDDRPPDLDTASWRLTVDDDSGRRRLTLPDLAALPSEEVTGILDCTSGWYSRQLWAGVRMDRLVDPGQACSVVVWAATGYARRFPVGDLEALWLATTVGGQPLSSGHGFPVRLVAPDRRGFWWVKWVIRVETSGMPWWVQSPYPLT
jgi:DMSO/TMAO reductase YedYZ molybdopterin-dependent catalytic subunit